MGSVGTRLISPTWSDSERRAAGPLEPAGWTRTPFSSFSSDSSWSSSSNRLNGVTAGELDLAHANLVINVDYNYLSALAADWVQ